MVKGTEHHIERALYSDGMKPVAFLANYLNSLNESGWHVKEAEPTSLDMAVIESKSSSPPSYYFIVHGSGRWFSCGPVSLIVTPTTPESESVMSDLYGEKWKRITEDERREEDQRLEAEKKKEERELAELCQATGMKVTRGRDGGYNFD